MFSFKSLQDSTQGFRFKVLGFKGLYRKRLHLSRGWKVEPGKNGTFLVLHMGKRSLYWESKTAVKVLYSFA